MLSTCRVLDLTDERGQLAGMILAQLGAEVIAVEPPQGARSRSVRPAPATHLAYNRGKRSVVLDLASADGRERFLDLVATADALIESFDPDVAQSLGLTYEVLGAVNPRLVVTSVSAYGRSGPKAGWPASDLTAEASGNELFLTGDADRSPVRVSVPQAFLGASADAACATIVGLWEARQSGVGQHADISAQEAATMITQGQILAAGYGAHPPRRNGAGLRVGPLDIRWIYPALDGWVTITLSFGPIAAFTRRLVDWVVEEGFLDPSASSLDLENFVSLMMHGDLDLSELERLQDGIAAFTASHSKADLLAGAVKRRVLLAPVSTVPELLESSQLDARRYWDEVDGVRYPGPFIQAGGGAPLDRLGPAPELGADTEAILTATPRRPAAATPAVGTPEPTSATPAPLAGVKVVDLTWFMAGPATTRMLADWGATVVRVESVSRPDGGRGSGPFLGGKADPDSGGYGLTHNAGKLGFALDLSTEGSRAVLEDLVRWADVAVVNYSPRATRNLGLDYPTLSQVNPRLILVSSSLMGQSGPLAEFAGFGNLSAAIAGFYEIGGWPDRPPVGPYLAYTDVVAPRFTFCSILAALEERERSGQGRYLDISQAESTMWLLAPAVVDYQLSGEVPLRNGNIDPNYAPHGVYPCAGEDSWVAIACTSDAQWQALAGLMGREDLGARADLASSDGRLAARDELDAAVSAWTASRDVETAEVALIGAGVAAHRLTDSAACWADPQLAHRGQFQRLTHPHHGEVAVQGPRLSFSRTQPLTGHAAPPIGEDTFRVLTEFLGYDPERVADLYAEQVLQ